MVFPGAERSDTDSAAPFVKCGLVSVETENDRSIRQLLRSGDFVSETVVNLNRSFGFRKSEEHFAFRLDAPDSESVPAVGMTECRGVHIFGIEMFFQRDGVVQHRPRCGMGDENIIRYRFSAEQGGELTMIQVAPAEDDGRMERNAFCDPVAKIYEETAEHIFRFYRIDAGIHRCARADVVQFRVPDGKRSSVFAFRKRTDYAVQIMRIAQTAVQLRGIGVKGNGVAVLHRTRIPAVEDEVAGSSAAVSRCGETDNFRVRIVLPDRAECGFEIFRVLIRLHHDVRLVHDFIIRNPSPVPDGMLTDEFNPHFLRKKHRFHFCPMVCEHIEF